MVLGMDPSNYDYTNFHHRFAKYIPENKLLSKYSEYNFVKLPIVDGNVPNFTHMQLTLLLLQSSTKQVISQNI